MPDNNRIRIVNVENRRDFNAFIHVPWHVYAQDKNWVPPLLMDCKKRLSNKNPYFRHAKWRAWIAYKNQKPVGRISAQVDELYLKQHNDDAGFFGMLEAVDDNDVIAALMSTAETWLMSQGMHRVMGPFNLSINQECGLLVEGHETPPFIMMSHTPPYYQSALARLGYAPAKDLLAYRIETDFETPEVMSLLTARYKHKLNVRPIDRRRLKDEFETMRRIFNDAWSDNWGFVPFTSAEFADIGHDLALLIDDDLIQIAEFEGEPAAMIVALPNLNEIIQSFNGRLLPLGWLKLIWHLKMSYPKTARVPLMGVRKKYQNTRVGSALAFHIIDAVRTGLLKRGVDEVELSWILEDNTRIQSILRAIGGRLAKRYRIYGKTITQPQLRAVGEQ